MTQIEVNQYAEVLILVAIMALAIVALVGDEIK